MMDRRRGYSFVLFLAIPLIVAGCAAPRLALDTPKHDEAIKRWQTDPHSADAVISLTLDQALERAMAMNLDARVAALEKLAADDQVSVAELAALPSVTLSASALGRTNKGGSASRSLQSGQTSLEPSQSSDQYRRTADLSARWNALDAAIAILDTRTAGDQAGIQQERLRKVRQTIQNDVELSYWRAATALRTGPAIEQARDDLTAQAERITTARSTGLIAPIEASDRHNAIMREIASLNEWSDQLEPAIPQLKALLSMPPSTQLVLLTPLDDARLQTVAALLKSDPYQQERDALRLRPELREQILLTNSAARDQGREILRTIPGLELFAGRRYDSNQFLTDPNWTDMSANAIARLLDLVTLPTRYDAAGKRLSLAQARIQALAAAIRVQVQLSRERLARAQAEYATFQSIYQQSARKNTALDRHKRNGFVSAEAQILGHAQALQDWIRRDLAYAETLNAAAALMTTLGYDRRGEGRV